MRRLALFYVLLAFAVGCTDVAEPEPAVSSSSTSSSTSTTFPTSSTTTPSTSTTLPDGFDPIPLGPLQPRARHSVVWTGEEMIVWGGCIDESCSTRFNDGAAFDPSAGAWRMIADSPLDGVWNHLAVWTGEEMLIVAGSALHDRAAAAYSPTTDTWRVVAEPPIAVGSASSNWGSRRDYVSGVWTGDEYVIWRVGVDPIAAYSPASDTWTDFPMIDLDVDLGVLRMTGDGVYAFGTKSSAFPDVVPLQGAVLVGEGWEPLPQDDLSTDQIQIAAEPQLTAWVHDRLITYGSGTTEARTIAYVPGSDSWVDVEPIPVSYEGMGPALTIGDRLLVFEAGVYDPMQDDWTPIDYIPGSADNAVWTGEEVLFWGNVCCYGAGPTPFEMAAWRFVPDR